MGVNSVFESDMNTRMTLGLNLIFVSKMHFYLKQLLQDGIASQLVAANLFC